MFYIATSLTVVLCHCPLSLRQLHIVFTWLCYLIAECTGAMKTTEVLIHSWVNFSNEDYRGYSFTVEWTLAMKTTEGTHSQLSEFWQWRPQRVLIHSWVNFGNEDHRGYSFTIEWTLAMKTTEGTYSQLSEFWQWGQRGYSFTVNYWGYSFTVNYRWYSITVNYRGYTFTVELITEGTHSQLTTEGTHS